MIEEGRMPLFIMLQEIGQLLLVTLQVAVLGFFPYNISWT